MLAETNLQNIPRDTRIKSLFVPRRGYAFVEVDLSQAESRIVAWKARERRLIEAYEKGDDIHSLVASMIFGKTVTKGMTERQVGKTIGHASNYNLGPDKGALVVFKDTGVVMSSKEFKTRQLRYYQQFPGIKEHFQAEIRRELSLKGRTITNPFGRVRRFWQPWGEELFRQAYSHFAQSSVADVINKGMLRCLDSPLLLEVGVIISAQIHDSLLFEVPVIEKAEFDVVLKEIKECMTIPFEVGGRVLSIPLEFKFGLSWGQMKEVKV